MKTLKRWNYEAHTYEDYQIPDDWHCLSYSRDMDEVVNCPHCGREITFGDGYTSMEIHNGIGGGYAVCTSCHIEEMGRSKENDQL